MEMTRTKRYLIQTAIFIVVFGLLLFLATMFDLQISHMLAKPYLADGAFYSTNPIGLIVEYIGSFPIFFLGIFACLIFKFMLLFYYKLLQGIRHEYNFDNRRNGWFRKSVCRYLR